MQFTPELRSDPAAYQRLLVQARTRDRLHLEQGVPGASASDSRNAIYLQIADSAIWSEDVGGHAAEQLLQLKLTPELRAGVIRAMWDEVRHSDMFYSLSECLRGPVSPPRALPQMTELTDALGNFENDLQFVALHTELESLALDMFRLITASRPPAAVYATYRLVSVDEASHVALGQQVLRHLVDRGARCSHKQLTEAMYLAQRTSPIFQTGFTDFLAKIGCATPDEVKNKLQARAARRTTSMSRFVARDG